MRAKADDQLVELVCQSIRDIRARGDLRAMRTAIDGYLRGLALALTREFSTREAYRVLQQATDDAALAIIEGETK